MTAVDEVRAAASHNSQLPFRKRIAPAKPALIEHHLPATIKTGDRVGRVLNHARRRFAKFRGRNFVRVEKEDPLALWFTIFEPPVSLLSKGFKHILVNTRAALFRDLLCS